MGRLCGRFVGLRKVSCAALAAVGLFLGNLSSSQATPRPAPFSCPYMTLHEGHMEVEQFVDMVPFSVRPHPAHPVSQGGQQLQYLFETELEYGLTDHLELGWYFVFRQVGEGEPIFEGVKQKLRYRFAESGAWPVDVGISAEMAELQNELDFEERLLLSKDWGVFALTANLWVIQQIRFNDGRAVFVYNPTMAATFNLSSHWSLGAEYWCRGRFDRGGGPLAPTGDLVGHEGVTLGAVDSTRHYMGPTLFVHAGEYFVSVGGYLRLDELRQQVAMGDPYGRVWVRALVGMGF